LNIRILSSVVAAALLALPAAAQSGAFPWKATDPPPALHGLRLGDSRARLDSLLGAPDNTQQLGEGVVAYDYPRVGLSVVYSDADGVSIVYAETRDAGSLDSIRVGDPPSAVVRRWGQPTEANGTTALFEARSWIILIEADSTGQRVTRIGVGRKA
jgi:hypothetical protein